MPFKHHNQEFKDDAIFLWEMNETIPKGERLTQIECAKNISNILGQSVSVRTIFGWKNDRHYENNKKGKKRGGYKPQPSKQEMEEFIDELLVNEDKLKKEVERLNNIIKLYRLV